MVTQEEIDKCRTETMRHVLYVKGFLAMISHILFERGIVHDRSKFESPEIEVFAEFTPRLAWATYGSQIYKDYLKAMKPALDHHYACNRHHPEHFQEEADATFKASPVSCMNLLDLVEMFCDWAAAVMRHADKRYVLLIYF